MKLIIKIFGRRINTRFQYTQTYSIQKAAILSSICTKNRINLQSFIQNKTHIARENPHLRKIVISHVALFYLLQTFTNWNRKNRSINFNEHTKTKTTD